MKKIIVYTGLDPKDKCDKIEWSCVTKNLDKEVKTWQTLLNNKESDLNEIIIYKITIEPVKHVVRKFEVKDI